MKSGAFCRPTEGLLRSANPAAGPAQIISQQNPDLQSISGYLWHLRNGNTQINRVLPPHDPDRRHDYDNGDELQQHAQSHELLSVDVRFSNRPF